ncbi:hypothetical protein BBF93_04820 [Hyphomonas sp. CACIAM 19H1]|uniref:serine hydrolase domain-containing protein n=1 Tax=Hyphomonas sp. CACIAM 19H1 TaxID=1873716 RepID=UPI000DEDCE6A|nr:serine hydrolase domain-containing protein [Hyphomonas sp. CACIAM 19H1]AXE63619.1 hypothetical protein BBF93_04820 [Hyphomonas sp. CACIAM 19H1]
MTKRPGILQNALTAASALLLTSCASAEEGRNGRAAPEKILSQRAGAAGSAADGLVREGQVPGALVMISQGSEIYTHARGYADLEQAVPVSEDTIFRFYSMTKPVTCAAVLTLLDDGLISLEDPVKDYLPEFADMSVRTEEGLRPAAGQLTIRHLMTHTSGLSYRILPGPVQEDYNQAGVFAIENRQAETLEAHVRRLAALPLVADPGTVWNYGESMGVLGRIVEVVSGKTFGTYLQERILTPLGMDDTGFYVPPEKAARLAQLYHRSTDGTLTHAGDAPLYGGSYLEKPLLEYGGAGLVGTAGDYMNFARMLLADGMFAGRRVLSSEAVALMTSNQLGPEFGEAPLAASGRGAGTRFGLCGYVTVDQPDGAPPGAVGEYGWSGWASTGFWIDRKNDLAGLVFTQVIPDDIGSVELTARVRQALYGPGED